MVSVRFSKSKTKPSDYDFGRGSQGSVHSVVLVKCVEFIYPVVTDNSELWCLLVIHSYSVIQMPIM